MTLPDSITGTWVQAQSDDDLRDAAKELHARFAQLDHAERARTGDAYNLMRGPEALTTAWMRWSMVNNEARSRGLYARSRR